MRFVDLFAGLGGFHLALRSLGHTCVFASEVDERLQDLYEQNFGIRPEGDIRSVSIEAIPAHDILCAGSPCQPFSKAGEQQGFNCPKWGDLFDFVLAVLAHHRPRYIILENVPNLTRHHDGQTWQSLRQRLKDIGYSTAFEYYSPHEFGIPQFRKRVFIVGHRGNLNGFEWPEPLPIPQLSIDQILDKNPEGARYISPRAQRCLATWQEFIKRFPRDEELPSFPIWTMEFGATYPYEEITPHAMTMRRLREFRGSHGKRLCGLVLDKVMSGLPSYARTCEDTFPLWKVRFIRQNRDLYERNKQWLKDWLPRIRLFPPSWQKLEWNCKGEKRNIWKYVIQFRASGVRVRRPTTAPSLVAMTTTQVPIIAWQRRYMTPRECARLQSMEQLEHLPEMSTHVFKALGNAVNAEVVRQVAQALLQHELRDKQSNYLPEKALMPLTETIATDEGGVILR